MLDLEEPISWEVLMVGIRPYIHKDVVLYQWGILPQVELVVVEQSVRYFVQFPFDISNIKVKMQKIMT
jgi:hypothetical protein